MIQNEVGDIIYHCFHNVSSFYKIIEIVDNYLSLGYLDGGYYGYSITDSYFKLKFKDNIWINLSRDNIDAA